MRNVSATAQHVGRVLWPRYEPGEADSHDYNSAEHELFGASYMATGDSSIYLEWLSDTALYLKAEAREVGK